jgi:ATP-dependent DNA ligase
LALLITALILGLIVAQMPKLGKTLSGARKAKLPKFVSPQLATLVKEPPSGDEWLHELKFDGYRMHCRIDRGGGRYTHTSFERRRQAIADMSQSRAIFAVMAVVDYGKIPEKRDRIRA